MDRNFLLTKIIYSVTDINQGRFWLATDGQEHEGRVSFEKGVLESMDMFREVGKTDELETMIFAELAFLQQELSFARGRGAHIQGTLKAGIQDLTDSLRCLRVAENTEHYKYAEATYLTRKRNREQGLPVDAFHQACRGHLARLANYMVPGTSPLEEGLLHLRYRNIIEVRQKYKGLQRFAVA